MSALQTLHYPYIFNVTSLSFVYIFLPSFLFLWHVSPKKIKPWVMLAFSLLFYALARPEYFILLIASVLLDFAAVRGLYIFSRRFWRGVCLWFCVIKNLGLIFYFGLLCQTGLLPLPFGLLIYCVLGIDAVVEAYREKDKHPRGLIYFASYVTFFPRLYAGPLSSYKAFAEKLDNAEFNPLEASKGFGVFTAGLLKYAILGRGLFSLYNSLCAIPKESESVLSAWLIAVSCALAFYFTLSGLSDIAAGISGMMGMRLPQNFYYPYQARGLTDFFERFNMTLGDFLTRIISPPSASWKSNAFLDCLSLVLMGALWGVWFGVRLNYILWGVFIAVFVILEKYAYPGLIKSIPPLFLRGYSLFTVMMAACFLARNTPAESFEHLRRMLGFLSPETTLLNDRALYVMLSNGLLLLVSLVLCFNALSLLTGFFRRALPKLSQWILGAVDFALLIAFTAITLRGGAL